MHRHQVVRNDPLAADRGIDEKADFLARPIVMLIV